MSASDQLRDLSIIRQILLQRLIAGENRKLNRQLNDIAKELERQIKSGKPLTTFQGNRLEKAIQELAAIVDLQTPDLREFAQLEAQYVVNSLATVSVQSLLPTAAALAKIAESSLVQGATINEWFTRLGETMRFEINRAVKLGISLGETNEQIARRIIGAAGTKGTEVMPRGRRDALAIVRTAVQTISNDSRNQTYLANQDVIKGVQWISVLDSRTTEICMARAGKVWSLPNYTPVGHSIPWNGGPPAHWSCRSTTIPVLKTWREMGIDMDELPASTRASLNGQVAADISFDEFLRKQPAGFADEMLGKGKAELWRSGKITLSQLLNAEGRPITLRELRERYGG